MKYLITDPCYVVRESEEWSNFVDKLYGGTMSAIPSNVLPYEVKGVGKMIELSNTQYGDGSMTYGKQEIGVDAGLVCIVELNSKFNLEKECKARGFYKTLGVIVEDREEAYEVYRQARMI